MSIWKMIDSYIWGTLAVQREKLKICGVLTLQKEMSSKNNDNKNPPTAEWWLNRELEQNPKTTRWRGKSLNYVSPHVKMLMRRLQAPPQIVPRPAHNWFWIGGQYGRQKAVISIPAT